MSITALESSSSSSVGSPIQRSVFMRPCIGTVGGGGRLPMVGRRGEDEDAQESSCSSSSSIGRNSDEESGDDCREAVAESLYKGPLDTMDAIEEGLPIKRGISNFYNGKSKSFTSLADASSASSVKDFAKPVNPYTRKRKNLLVHNSFLDKNWCFPPKDRATGISKRPANFNRRTLAHGLTMSYSKSNNNSGNSHLVLSSPPYCLPPLHPHGRTSLHNGACSPPPQQSSPCRSFSLSDLQCAAAATLNH